jgi:hypothetical protein
LLNKDPAIRPQDSRAVKERLERIALPFSEAQQKIQRLAAEHAEERMKETAAKAAKRAQDEQFEAWRRQGRADLDEICSDALVGLQAALPEISKIEPNPFVFSFECSDAALDFHIWNRWIFSPPDDVMLCAGDISARSRRSNRSWVLANIVYEQLDGRFIWRLYTFQANPLIRSYSYGPLDQDHGFKLDIFMEQRPYMLMNAIHIWTVKKVPLTSEAIVELFGKVLEFR